MRNLRAAAERGQKIDPDTLRRMADVIEYRGPDDAGIYVSGPVGLAMRRLSIIDLERGGEPMHKRSSHCSCVPQAASVAWYPRIGGVLPKTFLSRT